MNRRRGKRGRQLVFQVKKSVEPSPTQYPQGQAERTVGESCAAGDKVQNAKHSCSRHGAAGGETRKTAPILRRSGLYMLNIQNVLNASWRLSLSLTAKPRRSLISPMGGQFSKAFTTSARAAALVAQGMQYARWGSRFSPTSLWFSNFLIFFSFADGLVDRFSF